MRQSGTVKFYNAQKGYGFIKPDDGGKDIFVHVTAVERAGIGDLNEGMLHLLRDRARQAGQGPEGDQPAGLGVGRRSPEPGAAPASRNLRRFPGVTRRPRSPRFF